LPRKEFYGFSERRVSFIGQELERRKLSSKKADQTVGIDLNNSMIAIRVIKFEI